MKTCPPAASTFDKEIHALRELERAGFDVKELWRELESRRAAVECGTPTEDDLRYELPTECPKTESHLGGGNELLSPSRLWNGLSYALTPGQRGLLKDLYGLTPTMTVTVLWVEPWPGTRHPRRMCLRSDLHVADVRRKHVLTQAVIGKVGEFFRLAAERDVEEQKAEPLGEKMLTVGKVMKLGSEHRWAVSDLVSVEVSNRVEVTRVSAEKFTVLCLESGRQATLPRSLFFETVEEYVKLYRLKTPRATGKPFVAKDALDALLEGLG